MLNNQPTSSDVICIGRYASFLRFEHKPE